MTYAKSFRELACWQDAKELTVMIYRLAESNQKLRRDGDLRSQICRASVSIMNNIAEGYGRAGRKEFARFMDIAIGSCVEVQSMLDLILALSPEISEEAVNLQEQAERTLAKSKALVKYLRNTSK